MLFSLKRRLRSLPELHETQSLVLARLVDRDLALS